MFDESTEYDSIDYSVVACDSHRQLSLRASRESIVMLKNDGINLKNDLLSIDELVENIDDLLKGQ